jgi:RNA-directed DNA polymerase
LADEKSDIPLPSIRGVLDRRNLTLAWQQVRANRGAPGVDEVSVTRWERNWEENLDRLIYQVRTNTYRPTRPRRFRVLKSDGG